MKKFSVDCFQCGDKIFIASSISEAIKFRTEHEEEENHLVAIDVILEGKEQ